MDLNGLRRVYKTVAGRLVIDRLASLPSLQEMPVDDVADGIGVPRLEVIDVLKRLTKHGFGSFIVGRRGNVSRMLWAIDPRQLRAAAAGETDELASAEPPTDDDAEANAETTGGDGLIPYPFPLRPGLTVHFSLPKSLTRAEAERLARFIVALPYE